MFLTSHVLEVVERCDLVAIIHNGRLVKSGTMADLRIGSETLEDAFVRVVGADHPAETLDWL
jgi:ABC-2 type transport system ATP-binding protein